MDFETFGIEKTNLKIKWKSNKQNGGNHYIAIFRD